MSPSYLDKHGSLDLAIISDNTYNFRSFLIVGKKSCGKTTMIKNIINELNSRVSFEKTYLFSNQINKNDYKDIFKNIFHVVSDKDTIDIPSESQTLIIIDDYEKNFIRFISDVKNKNNVYLIFSTQFISNNDLKYAKLYDMKFAYKENINSHRNIIYKLLGDENKISFDLFSDIF